MAISVRKEIDSVVWALVDAFNSLQDAGWVADGYHRDLSQLTSGDPNDPASITLTTLSVDAAAATTLATTITLANNIHGVLHTHFLDAQAHLKADTVNDGYQDGYSVYVDGYSTSMAASVGAADLVAVCNELNVSKIAFNAHLTQSGVHVNNDTGNSVATTNATDLSSAEALANALAAAINLHISGPGSSKGSKNTPRINLIDP